MPIRLTTYYNVDQVAGLVCVWSNEGLILSSHFFKLEWCSEVFLHGTPPADVAGKGSKEAFIFSKKKKKKSPRRKRAMTLRLSGKKEGIKVKIQILGVTLKKKCQFLILRILDFWFFLLYIRGVIEIGKKTKMKKDVRASSNGVRRC